MHRPGIGSVRGDKIIFDGTTVDEMERVRRFSGPLVDRLSIIHVDGGTSEGHSGVADISVRGT
jgi:hypothetical protein